VAGGTTSRVEKKHSSCRYGGSANRSHASVTAGI